MYNPWYQRNKNPIQINKYSEQARGLVAWWPALASANRRILADIASRFDGSLLANVSWKMDSNFGPGLDFSGAASSYINAPAADTDFLGKISIVAWSNINVQGAFQVICKKHAGSGATNNPFDYRTDPSSPPKLVLVRADGSARRDHTGPAITINETHMYSVVTPSDQIEDDVTFYIDTTATVGTKTNSGTGNATGTNADICIGSRTGSLFLNGQIFDLKIYNRALSELEIRSLYDIRTRWDLYRPPKRYYAIAPVAAGRTTRNTDSHPLGINTAISWRLPTHL